jgi:hypothetical protein
MKRLTKTFFIFLLCYSANAISVEVQGLFEAEVITQSGSLEDRNKAIKEALTIVLKKVMVGENILENPTVKIALDDASRYTTQFQYSLIPSNVGDKGSTRVMRVKFDEHALMELMRSSNLGIWSAIRDEMLVWLVVDEGGKRKIYNEEQMPEMANALSKGAKRKGLPMLFPLMDLEERQKISINDILGAYSERLYEVSDRYGTTSMLVGRVNKNKKCWVSEWAFYFNNSVRQWSKQCSSLDESILSGVQGAYDKLSEYYAVKPESLEFGTIILKVSGIKGMTGMSKVTDYLTSLPTTEAVHWLKVKSGINYFKIKTSGSRLAFENTVGLGRVLDPLNTGKHKDNELEYRLIPEIIR